MPPESEVEDILLLNEMKSEDERYPLVESDACEIEKAPVEELYESGAEALRDDDEILLLKSVQSVCERYPLVDAFA